MTHIDPLLAFGKDFHSIQNPVRYMGGEYGQVIKNDADYSVALAFPDLYEIGMSNLAIKILYDRLNKLSGVRCERVFAPAPDFENLLVSKHVSLYTLETKIPLYEMDMVAVSIGYEPGITGLLSILHYGGIPLHNADRSESSPVVIAGGCGITNPAPFSNFIDAFYIGEAENGFFDLVTSVAEAKREGKSRSMILDLIEDHPAVWTKRKDGARKPGQPCAVKSSYADFGSEDDNQVCFPIPHTRIVQDHGSIEIMRGCPNGCRFCHAGMFYRPQRMKSISKIIENADFLIDQGGYREISLMSLSSGDYDGIDSLLELVNTRYEGRHVSFQLPSLKVNSFTLPLLEKMAEVRKSGLTFAIETPVDSWQLALNKEVYKDKIVSIILEAKKRGWSKAKFYFMVGLPVRDAQRTEEEEIVSFLIDIQEATRIQCNVNVGTFIPKPHTPYQWSRQLSVQEADQKLNYIRNALPKGRFKISTHRPFSSLLEAIISRGDERVGDIVLEAWRKGCRLDAWEDWAKPDIWKEVISRADWDVEAETIRARDTTEDLPWDGVSVGVTKRYLIKEKERSESQTLTPRCEPDCIERCGVCGNKQKIVKTIASKDSIPPYDSPYLPQDRGINAQHWRVVVSFQKVNEAAFIPHLGLLEIWNKAFQRSRLPILYTEGFNPLPRFEISQSLSLGISSEDEIGSFMLFSPVSNDVLQNKLSASLPESLRINSVLIYPLSLEMKRVSLSKLLWGNAYAYSFYDSEIESRIRNSQQFRDITVNLGIHVAFSQESEITQWTVTLPFSSDRPFRNFLAEQAALPIYEVVRIHKLKSLSCATPNDTPCSFFATFENIARINEATFS